MEAMPLHIIIELQIQWGAQLVEVKELVTVVEVVAQELEVEELMLKVIVKLML
jgi:hypothetical protein